MSKTKDDVIQEAVELLQELTSESEPCWFDHHGGCQEHGYLSGGCAFDDARKFIKRYEVNNGKEKETD